MARRTSLLRCLVAYPLLGLSGVLLAQEIPGGVPPGATLDDATFDPSDLEEAVAWWDASTFTTDGSTKDGSNNVTRWEDKIGSADLTGVAATPLWTDNAVNGLDAIDFERGDNDGLYADVAPLTAAPVVVYAVARLESLTIDWPCVFWLGDKDTTNNEWAMLGLASGATDVPRWVITAGGTALQVATATSVSTDTTYLFYGASYASDSHEAKFDNANGGTNANTRAPSGVDRVAIGRHMRSTPADSWDGFICEVVLLNASIEGTADEDSLIAYLDAKWSIPGVSTSPPLGPSDPYRWPLVLLAAGLAVLALPLRRRPQQREGRLLRLQPEAAARRAA